MIKWWPLLFLLFCNPVLGQSEFGATFFSFDDTSLTPLEELSEFRFQDTPFVKRSLNEFELNSFNYRQAVDMMAAVSTENPRGYGNVDIESLQAGMPGLRNDQAYISDGKTRVQNTVYKEMRGLDFVDSCPPFGVCARCAPFRAGRRGF